MIQTYVNRTEDDCILATVLVRVCSSHECHTHLAHSEEKLNAWLLKVYRDNYSGVIQRFIHQRKVAFARSNNQFAVVESLAILDVRFDGSERMPLKELVKRVTTSQEHLRKLYPPQASLHASWIPTIESLIGECCAHHKAFLKLQSDSSTFKPQSHERII